MGPSIYLKKCATHCDQERREQTMFTIVLCLKTTTHRQDIDSVDRFVRIGLASYKKNLRVPDVAEFIVITPPKERALIQTRLEQEAPEFPWTFVSENDVVESTLPQGWAKQQTAKLAIARRVKTPIYLLVDDDTFAVRPFGGDDLYHNSTLRMNTTSIDFPFFFLWSSEVLGADYEALVQPQPFHMAITPEVFVTSVVRDILKTLETRHGTQWQKAIVHNKFTEYGVYWIYLLMQNKTSLYATDAPLYAGATTSPDHVLAEQLKVAFDTERSSHIFSFVQTSLPISTDAIEEGLLAFDSKT